MNCKGNYTGCTSKLNSDMVPGLEGCLGEEKLVGVEQLILI